MEFEYICMVQTHYDRDTHNITIATATDDPTYLYVYYDEDRIKWWWTHMIPLVNPILLSIPISIVGMSDKPIENIRKGHVNTQLQWIWKSFCLHKYWQWIILTLSGNNICNTSMNSLHTLLQIHKFLSKPPLINWWLWCCGIDAIPDDWQ